MAKPNDVGVYRKDNGVWEYRFVTTVNGQQIQRKKCTDANGNKLMTKSAAIAARHAAIQAVRDEVAPKKKPRNRTVKAVYDEYCKSGRRDRAYQTIKKQDCLWKNHLSARFGKRRVDGITSAEIVDYLSELYHLEGYSYRYVESFLKMFYLIFGQAYSRNFIDVDTYNKLCINKDTKIRMPKLRRDDDMDIVVFTAEELEKLDKYFAGKYTETAYLLGRYCGLRVNECFGLKWSNVDLENGTITIDRQMQYQEGVIKLIAPKTRNSRRTLHMSDVLWEHMKKRAAERETEEREYADLRLQNRRWITDMDGKLIPSTDMVNCIYNGRLQTPHSLKYASREIHDKLKIDFNYHFLRHTYGTMLAEMNTPTHLLCNQMGHGNIHVTQRYYLAISQGGVDILRNKLNQL